MTRSGHSSHRYPFSVLGLGDIVVPGAFVSLLRQADLDGLGSGGEARDARLNPRDRAPRLPTRVAAAGRPQRSPPTAARAAYPAAPSYFKSGLAGYSAGLAATFAANMLTKSGQPALVRTAGTFIYSAGCPLFMARSIVTARCTLSRRSSLPPPQPP